MDVKEEVLEDGSKTSKAKGEGVNCQRKQDKVFVKDVTCDRVTNDGDVSCWVGLVVASELLLFVFLQM